MRAKNTFIPDFYVHFYLSCKIELFSGNEKQYVNDEVISIKIFLRIFILQVLTSIVATTIGIDTIAAPSGSYYITVKNVLQRPELPTGCEPTALTIALHHLGFNVNKCNIVDKYLPITSKQYSLNTHFVGNPYSDRGYGCNAPVIVNTANAFLEDVNSLHQAILITGSSPDQLYVSQGYPVICWVTIAMIDTYISATWVAIDTGETMNFMTNEHCTVLVGYDTNLNTVTLNDPWKGVVTYSMSLFEKRYSQLGNQAIIIK